MRESGQERELSADNRKCLNINSMCNASEFKQFINDVAWSNVARLHEEAARLGNDLRPIGCWKHRVKRFAEVILEKSRTVLFETQQCSLFLPLLVIYCGQESSTDREVKRLSLVLLSSNNYLKRNPTKPCLKMYLKKLFVQSSCSFLWTYPEMFRCYIYRLKEIV